MECPLLRENLRAIAEERGELHLLGDPAYPQNMLDMMLDPDGRVVGTRGPRLNLTRWMSWFDCISYWWGLCNMRLVVLLYWGLTTGVLTQCPGSCILKLAGSGKASKPESAAASMREANAATRNLYDASKNQLHVGLVVLMDPSLLRRQRIAFWVCAGVRKWHGDQRKALKCAESVLHFYRDQAASQAYYEPLYHAFGVFQQTEALRSMKFVTSLADLPRDHGIDDGHPMVRSEVAAMEQAMRLAFCVVGQRVRSGLWHFDGPGMFAFMASDDPTVQTRGLEHMAKHWAIFREAQLQVDNPHIMQQVRDHWMNDPLPARIFRLAAGIEFDSISADMRSEAAGFYGIGNSGVIEDAFQRCRSVESRGQSNDSVQPSRVHQTVVTSTVLSKLHHYKEPDFRKCPWEVALKEGGASKASGAKRNDLYKPEKCQKPKVDLKACVGDSQSHTWNSYTAQSMSGLYASAALWEHCVEKTEQWALAGRAWLCQLMSSGRTRLLVMDCNCFRTGFGANLSPYQHYRGH